MMDFIYELYKNDHFTLYLTIILVILIILFVVVLFFGKKDQKLEETRRLQKIELENNTFKEEKEEPVKLEVEAPVQKEEIPIEESKDVQEITLKPMIEEPLKVEESEPVIKHEDNLFNFEKAPVIEEEPEDIDLSSLASIKDEFNKIEIPSISDENNEKVEEVKEEKIFKPSQVFSSVYVNNNSESNKVESKDEIKTSNEVMSAKLFTIADDDDEDMELPSLKG